MQTENLEGQESIFGRDSGFGKMSSALSQVGGTLKRVKKKPGADFQKVLEAFLQVEEPYER